ncbi:MAG: hypothetical protein CFH37_00387 [Alphaproteobacteria bacterium MarineAlpha9_Bin7]|nr:MAG: hypothetical protein CFH37_00387 [Alphaproteobacteria bacterium MarineAlpha9_Bin7]
MLTILVIFKYGQEPVLSSHLKPDSPRLVNIHPDHSSENQMQPTTYGSHYSAGLPKYLVIHMLGEGTLLLSRDGKNVQK